MYIVELTFDDDPRRLAARAAHRERLHALASQDTLVLAGPLADDSGAVLVFDLESEAELREVIDKDPYYRVPGVTVGRTREWTPIAGRAQASH